MWEPDFLFCSVLLFALLERAIWAQWIALASNSLWYSELTSTSSNVTLLVLGYQGPLTSDTKWDLKIHQNWMFNSRTQKSVLNISNASYLFLDYEMKVRFFKGCILVRNAMICKLLWHSLITGSSWPNWG